MRIRIIRRPEGSIEGIDLTSLHQGSVHELSSGVASVLLLLGYARVEMRVPLSVDQPSGKPEIVVIDSSGGGMH